MTGLINCWEPNDLEQCHKTFPYETHKATKRSSIRKEQIICMGQWVDMNDIKIIRVYYNLLFFIFNVCKHLHSQCECVKYDVIWKSRDVSLVSKLSSLRFEWPPEKPRESIQQFIIVIYINHPFPISQIKGVQVRIIYCFMPTNPF